MNITELIKTRKSVRTFDGRPLSEEDEAKLRAFCEKTENPFGIPVSVVWLDAKERGLSSPVIVGETAYLACKTPKRKRCELAVGYAFERIVLYAWSLGVGSCFIGDIMENMETQRSLLQLPEFVFPAAMLVFGYPTEQQQNRPKPPRAALEYLVQENTYTPLDDAALRRMLLKNCTEETYESWLRAFHARKYDSDFAREMTRSVAAFLRQFERGDEHADPV